MDNKQKLEELEKEKRKLEDELRGIAVDIEEKPQNAEYMDASEEERKEKYPELVELYQRQAEISSKYDALIEEIDSLEETIEKERIAEGKEKYEKIEQDIAKKEKEIESTQEQVKVAMQEIQAINKEIVALKATDEYKDGDEETLDKVKELESELEAKVIDKNKIVKSLKDMRTEINKLNEEKAKLVEEYGEEIIPKVEEPVVENIEEQQSEEITEKEQDISKQAEDMEDKEKTSKPEKPKVAREKKNTNGFAVGQNLADVEPKSRYALIGNNAVIVEKTEEQQEIDEKMEFEELFIKAKDGRLTDGEFTNFIEILKQPKKYDELGITTGIIFNKSRRIFRALEKNIGNIDELSIEVKAAFAKELVGETDGKELLDKIAKMEKDGLTEDQQSLLDKVKSTLSKQELLEQAKYVRDTVALEKNEKHWLWSRIGDFTDIKKRLAEAKTELEKPKCSATIPGLEEQNKTEEEKNKSYGEPVKSAAVKEEKDHDSV